MSADSSTLSPASVLDEVGGQQHTLAAVTRGKRPGRTRLPQGRSGRVRKILPTPRLDPRTIQPVMSRYTDCATPAHKLCVYGEKEILETHKFREVVTFFTNHK